MITGSIYIHWFDRARLKVKKCINKIESIAIEGLNIAKNNRVKVFSKILS